MVVMSPEIVTFVRSCGIGAAIAAPVGPMSLLLMRRTLAQGIGFGLSTGAGIAAGDGFFALVAALGLTAVMRFAVAYERPLHFAAGAFLVYLGWRAFFGPVTDASREAAATGSAGAAFGSALLLTLTNPPTIVSFVAVFTALSPAGGGGRGSLAMVGGVFAGSLLWWLFVTLLVGAARHALGARTRRWIDRLSGAALGALGAAEIRRAV
jgi:threonine/homoserine/homoserine lactone efflux protein